MTLSQNDYVKDMFNLMLTSAIIFVCLCIENAIREYHSERRVQIKFETSFMHDEIDFSIKDVSY